MTDSAANRFAGTSTRLVGIWFGVAANLVAIGAGGVFFFAPVGARFRGMEPEAAAFTHLFLLAAGIGVWGLPLSIRDLFWRRRWISGQIGVIFAFTPVLTAAFVMDVAAWQRSLIWD